MLVASAEGDTLPASQSTLPIESVKHLDDYKSRQGHGRRLGALKDVAVDALEMFILYQALGLVGLQ